MDPQGSHAGFALRKPPVDGELPVARRGTESTGSPPHPGTTCWDSPPLIHKGSGSGATWGRKSHYRGKEIRKREKGVDAFACNQVRLLLAGFGYQIMHVQRAVLERVTGTGWSLRRLAERVLRTPARFTVSGRRITMTTGGASAHWRMLARGLATLHGPSG